MSDPTTPPPGVKRQSWPGDDISTAAPAILPAAAPMPPGPEPTAAEPAAEPAPQTPAKEPSHD